MLEENANITYEQYQKNFVEGNQFVVWNDVINQPVECSSEYYWEQHFVYNLMRSVVNRWLANYEIPESALFGKNKIIDDLIPYQRNYNLLMNNYNNLLIRFSSPILLVEDGSIDCDELAEEGLAPGKILIYRQGSNQPEILKTIVSGDLECIRKQCEAAEADFYSAVYRAEEILIVQKSLHQKTGEKLMNIEVKGE